VSVRSVLWRVPLRRLTCRTNCSFYGLLNINGPQSLAGDAVEFAIRNFLAFTNEKFGLQLLVGPKQINAVCTMLTSMGILDAVNIVQLPMLNWAAAGVLFTMSSLWAQLPGPQNATFLVFETDTVMLRKMMEDDSPRNKSSVVLQELTAYAFVGAPWDKTGYSGQPCRIGNGGFSLRKRAAMVHATTRFRTRALRRARSRRIAEDIFFGEALAELNYSFPPCQSANHFSIERVPCRYSRGGTVKSFLLSQDFSKPVDEAALARAYGGTADQSCSKRTRKSHRTAWRSVPEDPPIAIHQMLPWVKEWVWGVWRRALITNLQKLIKQESE